MERRAEEYSYIDHLQKDGMEAKWIGILKSLFGKEKCNESTNQVIETALQVFRDHGATWSRWKTRSTSRIE